MKNMRTGFSIAGLAAAILLLLPFAPRVAAQDYDQGYNDQDPPTRAGRIGYVEGSVSFQPGGEGDWVTAVPNRPLTVGDNLWVDSDSRAEVQIGSTSIRLGPQTSITFLDLSDNVTQLRLSLGSVIFRVRNDGSDNAIEVDTPNLAFNVTSPGEYRLDVNENGDQTIAQVYEGEGQITGAGDSYRLMAGQRGTFSGVDQLSYDVDQIGRQDDFYRWVRSRDERQDRFRSARYVSTEMTGYEDLDDYGRWDNIRGYGYVWTPVGVPYDWAPYRYGHWVYIAPWGWTWVEDEPWGFAPFHYGRWAYVRSHWCWVPGPVVVRPVYAPALVAFIGGGGFSIGIGVGSGVGWFPLAPGEVYVPWYRTSPRYVQNVNVTNTRVNVVQVTNVYNNYTVNKVTNVTYVNQRVRNSVTVVNHDTFVNARPVYRNVVRVDSRQIQRAQVSPAVIRTVQPDRQSVVGTARQVNYRPPQRAITRPVVATRQPVVASRPMDVPNVGRVTTPPVRTVRAVPVTQAQPLQRGARGNSGPARTEAAPRNETPANNRQPAAIYRGNSQPDAPAENPGPSRPVVRDNRPQPDNRPAVRMVPRPNAPETNRNVNSGNSDQQNQYGSGPRGNNGRGSSPERIANPRGSAPENQPGRPEDRGNQAPRPSSVDRQPQMVPEQSRGNSSGNRPESMRAPESRTMPQQTSRPPEMRQAPQSEMRPAPAPQPRTEMRSEPASRPEPRAAEPPRVERNQGQGENKGNNGGGQNHGNHGDNGPHDRH